jgi:tRNA 2-thiouridine synthesizing protein C
MKLLFIQSKPPHGSINAQEGLDAVLMGSAFSDCTLLLTGEGVLQLIKSQDPTDLGTKDFARTFGALRDYGVNNIYADAASLERYQLSAADLVIEVETLAASEAAALIASHDKVLNF